jgi:hypothetical protein
MEGRVRRVWSSVETALLIPAFDILLGCRFIVNSTVRYNAYVECTAPVLG